MATMNSEEVIEKAIESINKQTYKNYELIIVDGNSIDNTIEIIRKFDLNIKVISENDEGIYDALNKGLKIASGDFVYVMGSDDIFYDENVLEDVNGLVCNQYGMVYGNIISRDRFNEKLILMKKPEEYKIKNIKCPPIFHQSVFMRRELLFKSGFFPVFYKIHADHFIISYLFNITNSLHIERIICSYNNNGFSGRRLGNYMQSSMEQLRISIFFKNNLINLLLPFAKNFVMALIVSIKKSIS